MSVSRKKSPIIAGALSVIFPGAGQLYNEDFIKGVILIAGAIASIVSIVYAALSLGGMFMNGEIIPEAVQIVKIVIAGLIFAGIWFYGVIDAVIRAQRSATDTNPPVEQAKTREGTIALGVVLVIFGILCIAVQMGLKFEYLVKYGLPGALILYGVYLLAKTGGFTKGGK